jgi:hypothetical protein
MPVPEFCRISAVKEKKLKLAAGCRCERCAESFPLRLLELHFLEDPAASSGTIFRDVQKFILVVCPVCHHEIHSVPVPAADVKEIVRSRPAAARRAMRRILSYIPQPYHPPENTDLAQVFAEVMNASRDIFFNGT